MKNRINLIWTIGQIMKKANNFTMIKGFLKAHRIGALIIFIGISFYKKIKVNKT